MVSVVIPLYNDRDGLIRLLGSLVMQTYKDFEVVIIDDFSDDDYCDILDNFRNYIKIWYEKLDKNYGSGYARGYGLSKADGDYILFADSDDTLLDAFGIHRMVSDIEKDDYDFCSYGYIQECEDLTFNAIKPNATWVFGKLYRKSFLDKYDINFTTERYNEDVYFNQICYALAEKIFKSEETFYMHHINDNSVTKTDGYKKDDMCSFIRNYIKAYNFVNNVCSDGLSDKQKWQFTDGLLIMYNFYTEKIRTKNSEYCKEFFNLIVEYYVKIYKFVPKMICDDEFATHYSRIHQFHGVHNKNLICTMDWFTFINNVHKVAIEVYKVDKEI